jgi:hypothetical protein
VNIDARRSGAETRHTQSSQDAEDVGHAAGWSFFETEVKKLPLLQNYKPPGRFSRVSETT